MSIKSITALYYAAAAATAIAGILHLITGPPILKFNANIGIFFIVAGIIQIFWALPMVRRWGIVPWYSVGIVGTIALMILYAYTRLPGNPFFVRGASINANGIAIELLQAAYIGLTAAIIIYESKRRNKIKENTVKDTA